MNFLGVVAWVSWDQLRIYFVESTGNECLAGKETLVKEAENERDSDSSYQVSGLFFICWSKSSRTTQPLFFSQVSLEPQKT